MGISSLRGLWEIATSLTALAMTNRHKRSIPVCLQGKYKKNMGSYRFLSDNYP